MNRFSDINKMKFSGVVRERYDNNLNQWLTVAPYANPGIFEAFFRRENADRWILAPWYGEFPGKLLTGVAENYRMSRDDRLFNAGEYIVDQLSRAQADDGYLGVAPYSERMVGKVRTMGDDNIKLWDIWSHYHCIFGLYLWYLETETQKALDTALKAADYICGFFLDSDRDVSDAGEAHTNMSAVHVFAVLYEATGNRRYLEMVRHFEAAIAGPKGFDYLNEALAGKEFYQTRLPRWETVHAIMSYVDMLNITGDDKYRRALDQIWASVHKTDIHNTGSFSSYEQATGNPYDGRP